MKILIYSDLHLEFKHGWTFPDDVTGDLLILAGDIITFGDYSPLEKLLKNWSKPVLYVAGNHEYYTQTPMDQETQDFKVWLSETLPQVTLLMDEHISISGVNFFGGTMWTDFGCQNPLAMDHARRNMNDFRLIRNSERQIFTPQDTISLHQNFIDGLIAWFKQEMTGPRIVISHHAPVINPNTQYRDSPLQPAFNSLDMIEIIEEHQPDFWIYGHTHECDDQTIGRTRIISNQLGYPNGLGGFECLNFDRNGKVIEA